jgi:hypothetical protein
MAEARSWLGIAALLLAATAWAFLLLGYLGVLAIERPSSSGFDFSCSPPASSHLGDSDYGYSTWGWLPPGRTCHFSDGTTERPGTALTVVPVILLVGLAGGASAPAVARVRRRARTGSRTPADSAPFPPL